MEQKPGGRGPAEENLPAEEERLPDDQGDHAHVHRVPRQPVRAADDEALRRGPGRRRAAPLEREAGRGLEDERGAENQDDPTENPENERLPVPVPASEQPRDEPGDECRAPEEDEAERACRRP